MANTFSQIYVQAVFAVAWRQSLIKPDFKKELQKYITGIIQNKGQKLTEINCMPDHAHLLIGLKPAIALSDLIRDVKSSSTEFVNRRKIVRGTEVTSGDQSMTLEAPLRALFCPRKPRKSSSADGPESVSDVVVERGEHLFQQQAQPANMFAVGYPTARWWPGFGRMTSQRFVGADWAVGEVVGGI
jgi:REP element-mobilizing transposase RayT